MIPDVFSKIRKDILEELGLDGFKIGRRRLLLVTGSNATGKSFVRRLFEAFCPTRFKIHTYTMSFEHRSKSSMSDNPLIGLLYGAEFCRATSANTVSALRNMLRSSAKSEKRHLVIIDEPEIGLSEETELAVGSILAREFGPGTWPENRVGAVVIEVERLRKPRSQRCERVANTE